MSGIDKSDILRARTCVERHTRTIDNHHAQQAECLRFIEIHADNKCWSCKSTGPTTDLVPCEVANRNYPEACPEYSTPGVELTINDDLSSLNGRYGPS